MAEKVLVVDLGSQYSSVIVRTLRELGVQSALLAPKEAAVWLKDNRPQGVILSGGSASVYEQSAPEPPEEILKLKVPILGICYGFQWLVRAMGGVIGAKRAYREYGATEAILDPVDPLFSGLERETIVWASHGDSIQVLPSGFCQIAQSRNGDVIAGMSNIERKIWGLLFHPEVTHTLPGKDILCNFLFSICGCQKDWEPEDIIAGIRSELIAAVGGHKVILGYSGGVDSSTLAAMMVPVLEANLLGVTIDTGGLRQDELKEIQANARVIGLKLKVVHAARRFFTALEQETNAERKRQIFKLLYVQILEEVAALFGATILAQGTLRTDLIESGAVGQAAKIKTHHNDLSDLDLSLEDIHPLRELFKYEVRVLARALGLPPNICERKPFPGPGLFVRVVGVPATQDKIGIVRWADDQVTRILKAHREYEKIAQLVVGLWGLETVGIKGDKRTYTYPIAVRGVKTEDFMTEEGYWFPEKIGREICSVLTQHEQITRVIFDPTNKPPATTEFE